MDQSFVCNYDIIELMFLFGRILNTIRSWLRSRSRRNFTLDVGTLHALERAAREEKRTPQDIARHLLNQRLDGLLLREQYLQRWDMLSQREQQVAALVCLGYTTRQISAWLGIRPETVKTYAESALAKFGVPNRKTLRVILRDWDFQDWEQG